MDELSRRDFLFNLGLLGVSAGVELSGLGDLLNRTEISNTLDDRTIRRRKKVLEQGYATKIPAFEFHEDEYYFNFDGYEVELVPEYFNWMMEWFNENDYWAANVEEVIGYINGEMLLPAKTVILTTDSANDSQKKLKRMTPVLERTGMHFISFILTTNMKEGESSLCENNACWDTFNELKESGFYTFGTHSETHRSFRRLTYDEAVWDLMTSKKEIEEYMGIEVELIAWPSESIPKWTDKLPLLKNYGFKGSFAGNGPGLDVCYPNHPNIWVLPRILPPNSKTGLSQRPGGKNIEEIMEEHIEGKEITLPRNPMIKQIVKQYLINEGFDSINAY